MLISISAQSVKMKVKVKESKDKVSFDEFYLCVFRDAIIGENFVTCHPECEDYIWAEPLLPSSTESPGCSLSTVFLPARSTQNDVYSVTLQLPHFSTYHLRSLAQSMQKADDRLATKPGNPSSLLSASCRVPSCGPRLGCFSKGLLTPAKRWPSDPLTEDGFC